MPQVKSKPIYKPDLDGFISQCEINYCLIVTLFPSLAKPKYERLGQLSLGLGQLEIGQIEQGRLEPSKLELSVALNVSEFGGSIIQLTVIEAVSYTTTLELEFNAPSNIVKQNLKLIVRMYHDAKMLEVMDGISVTELSAIRAIQEKSSHPVKFADEKRQLNAFLGESLKYCLKLTKDKIEQSERNGSQN